MYHFIGDTVLLQCLIDANPEPDIRWLHRFPNDINEEMDLSRQFSQENFDDHEKKNWYIQNEQLNASRWKTSLFIQVNTYFYSRKILNSCLI